MRNELKVARLIMGPWITMIALPLSVGLMSVGCEASDNIDSYFVCQDYCTKKFDCDSQDPTANETDDCVASCRGSIEDDCGNVHQAAANDKIAHCVDLSCAEFWSCMVFEASPVCFGFVDP